MTPEEIELPDANVITGDEVLLDAEEQLDNANGDLSKMAEAIENICTNAVYLNNDIRANLIFDILSKKYKIPKPQFNTTYKQIKELHEAKTKIGPKLPSGLDYVEVSRLGFFVQNNAYLFLTKDDFFKASNFVIKPLYHIYSKNDNKRLIEVTNEWKNSRVIDVPSGKFVSVDQFQQQVFAEGNFIFFGTKIHFLRIIENISNSFPIANELITLGWQREGFYAFANGIFNHEFQKVNEFGIIKHDKNLYFSPSFSKIYSDLREDDDSYENDRFFVYKETQVNFSQWAKLFSEVYGTKARIGIAFLIASLFRDIIYDKYKFFPHLFLFGEKQSGKSQFAWSLSNIFFDSLPSFNLNSGTQVGFFRRLSRIKNAVCWFDEYSNDIDERRFQSLKAAYDGTGHEKGKKTTDGRTEITKVQSSCIISGQYLPSRDDNALLSRSILLNFEKQNYSKAEIEVYERLKELEVNGLSGILSELIPLRENIAKYYAIKYSDAYTQLKELAMKDDHIAEERLIRNFASILAPVKIIQEHHPEIDLSFTYDELLHQSVQMISNLSSLISASESISTFWNLIEYMRQNLMIREKEDFKITTYFPGNTLEIYNKYGIFKTYQVGEIEELLFLRLSRIYPQYLELHRKQFGKNGMDLSTCIHYLTVNPYFIGKTKSTRFGTINTSAMVFKYKELKIDLTEFKDIPEPTYDTPVNQTENVIPPYVEDQQTELPF